jgi:endonuclease/exonuclease/phosphatase family metal-dependent hydrolase
MRKIATALAALLLAGTAQASDLTVSTWNVGWLTDRAASVDTGKRRPIYQRTHDDYARLAAYAADLRADIIALQEVDGVDAARHLFPDGYHLLTTREDDIQRPVLAVRDGLAVKQHHDLKTLDLLDGEARSLRRGLDVTVGQGAGAIRILVIHLKSGCFSPTGKGEACDLVERQFPIVSAWIDQRQAEGGNFIVLGDFNRRLAAGPTDPMRGLLDNGPAPLTFIHGGRPSPCWGGEYPEPIDHIILGGPIATRPHSGGRTLVYQETDASQKDRLSDHCPVSVTLTD